MNSEPLSLITTSGSPKYLHTVSLKILAIPSDVTSPFVGANLIRLDSLSTTTIMASCPRLCGNWGSDPLRYIAKSLLELYWEPTSLLVLLGTSLFVDICHTHLHMFSHLHVSLATSSS